MREPGDRALDDVGGRDIHMARHGADDDGVAVTLDALELGDLGEVDEIGRPRQALLQGRNQRHAAGQQFRFVVGADHLGGVGDALRLVVLKVMHGWSLPYSAALGMLCAAIARHTRSDVAGISRSLMPSGASAFTTAFITAAGAPMAPASPQPLTPSGLCVQGVPWVATVKDGNRSARGMQ